MDMTESDEIWCLSGMQKKVPHVRDAFLFFEFVSTSCTAHCILLSSQLNPHARGGNRNEVSGTSLIIVEGEHLLYLGVVVFFQVGSI